MLLNLRPPETLMVRNHGLALGKGEILQGRRVLRDGISEQPASGLLPGRHGETGLKHLRMDQWHDIWQHLVHYGLNGGPEIGHPVPERKQIECSRHIEAHIPHAHPLPLHGFLKPFFHLGGYLRRKNRRFRGRQVFRNRLDVVAIECPSGKVPQPLQVLPPADLPEAPVHQHRSRLTDITEHAQVQHIRCRTRGHRCGGVPAGRFSQLFHRRQDRFIMPVPRPHFSADGC